MWDSTCPQTTQHNSVNHSILSTPGHVHWVKEHFIVWLQMILIITDSTCNFMNKCFSWTETAFISNNRHECRNVNGRTRPTNYGTRVKLYKFYWIITAREADIWLHLSSNHLFWNNIVYIGPQEYHNCVVIYIQLDRSHKLFQRLVR